MIQRIDAEALNEDSADAKDEPNDNSQSHIPQRRDSLSPIKSIDKTLLYEPIDKCIVIKISRGGIRFANPIQN
jgi:hypothetical protein